MKTIKFTIAACALGLLFTSCKDEKVQVATENVEAYSIYVDSISNLDFTDANSNWKNIENGYNNHKSIAITNVEALKEKESLKMDIEATTSKFEVYKSDIVAQKQQQEMVVFKNNFRTSLLGKNYIHDDMKFAWINKDNILSIYQNFVDTVDANKDNYSREDWDEIKLLYEAIDTRKNTVETKGLTSADNRKIAGLKLKFGPMLTVNRMGAKSEENANAKQ